MSFINRNSNSLGLFAAGSIAAAVMTVAPSASAQVPYLSGYDSQNDPELETIAEPPEPELATIAESPAPAPGTVPANKGVQMALGVGYSIPFGDVDNSLSQADFISRELPLILELGYKVTPHFYFGSYVGYGFGDGGSMVDKLCISSSVTCSLSTVRIGFNLRYHILPEKMVNPYFGVGMGHESASFRASGPDDTAMVIAKGIEFARFTVGADFRTNPFVGFGPYVNLGIGTYTSVNGGPIADAQIHGWLNLGMRVALFP